MMLKRKEKLDKLERYFNQHMREDIENPTVFDIDVLKAIKNLREKYPYDPAEDGLPETLQE